MFFHRATFLLSSVVVSGCSLDSESDVLPKLESKTVSMAKLKSETTTEHPIKLEHISAKQIFDNDKKTQKL